MNAETRELSIGEALDLGAAFAMRGKHENAIPLFRGVLIHEPENFEAIERLGTSLFEHGLNGDRSKLYEALYCFWRGRRINRRHPLALTNYGLCVSQLGHTADGLADLERAVYHAEKSTEISPAAKALIYNNLGNTLERLCRHAEALPILDKGIACNPSDPFPHYNRGIVLLRLNRHREAIAALQHSLDLRGPAPAEGSASRLNDADAYYNLAMAHLLMGNLKEGFAHYEHRLLTSENDRLNLGLDPARKWRLGDDVAGKRVLVHCEQGLGDTIQFLRFLPQLVAAGAEVLLIAHAAIRPMVAIEGVRVLQPGEDMTGRFDCWVALMSLPLYLGVEREEQIPAPVNPLLEPQWDQPIALWAQKLAAITQAGLPRVGVCWAGNFQHRNDAHRSIPLRTFATLFDAPCNFVSVQQMRAGETHEFAELKERHPNLQALDLEDLRDTAAVLLNLDLVITADTAVAHLAATLGIPTWILIPAYSTDWRWQLNRSDSPWYPSAELYRQGKIGDWASVMRRIVQDLSTAAAHRRAA